MTNFPSNWWTTHPCEITFSLLYMTHQHTRVLNGHFSPLPHIISCSHTYHFSHIALHILIKLFKKGLWSYYIYFQLKLQTLATDHRGLSGVCFPIISAYLPSNQQIVVGIQALDLVDDLVSIRNGCTCSSFLTALP